MEVSYRVEEQRVTARHREGKLWMDEPLVLEEGARVELVVRRARRVGAEHGGGADERATLLAEMETMLRHDPFAFEPVAPRLTW